MEITYVDNLTSLVSAREELMKAPVLGVDTETTGFDPHDEELILLQLAPSPDKAYVFNLRELNDPEEFTFFKDYLASDRVVCFQNAKFDVQFLTHFFGARLAVESMYDTMINSKLLARGNKVLRHSLDEIATRELGKGLDKSLQKSDFGAKELSEAQIAYAARDAAVLLEIRESQKAKLQAWGLDRVARLEGDAVAPIADTEYKGIYLDAEEWEARVDEQDVTHAELEKVILGMMAPKIPVVDLWGEPVVNLDSPQQLAPILRNLGIPLGDSTDETALGLVRDSHPVIEHLLQYREVATARKKFGHKYLKFISPVTGRIHADFQQIEAPSGRMSCRNPNLQQLPSEKIYRTPFKAQKPGNKLITADYSQIELRIMAKQSGDPILVQAYMNDEDLHNVTCHRVLGEPMVNPDPARRKIAKNLNFGTAYGVSPEGFAVVAGVSLSFAEKTLKDYWSVYQVLAAYLRGQASLAADHGICKTMSGRTAILHVDREDQEAYAAARRLGRNFGVQGTGADILKTALYLFHKQQVKHNLDAWVVNIVHDEILVETGDDPEFVAKILEDAMLEAGNFYLDPIPCKVGISIGDTWSK